MRRVLVWMGVFSALAAPTASAQLMIPDSGTGDRIMLFDQVDGSLIDLNWLTDAGAVGWFFTTPKEAMVVGNEIWVSDQVADAIHRFDMSRNFLSSITTHPDGGLLDNLRGMGTDGANVYLTISPSDSARRGVAIYDTSGTPTGFFSPGSDSLFDAEPFQGDLLVSNSTTDNIERYTTGGVFSGDFATGVDFPQQVLVLPDDSVVAVASIASAGIEGVYHFNADGSLRLFIDTEGLKGEFGEQVPRGAFPLGDGGYLIATSIGVFRYDVDENDFSRIVGDVSAQYITLIPEPASLVLLMAGAGVLARRR